MVKHFNETEALNKALESVRFAAGTPKSHQAFRPFNRRESSAGGITKALEGFPMIENDGTPLKVALTDINDSPYQTSNLNQEKVQELVENLRVNPLTTPVVVRKLDNGRFELIAGRHRLEAYKVLGRSHIETVVREMSNDEAERVVFYDNLFGPRLSDYQKYLGFSSRRESKDMTLTDLAQEAGVDRTLVSKLMLFSKFPAPVHEALREYPDTIGFNQVPAFLDAAGDATDRMVEAILKIAAGEMTQRAAIKWLREGKGDAEAPKPSPVKKVTVKTGDDKVYAEVTNKGKSLVVKLAGPAQAAELESRLLALLQEIAQQPA